MLKYLISKGVNVNADLYNGVTPIFIAVNANKPDMLKILIDNGADTTVSLNGDTPLELAIDKKYHECVELLMRNLVEDDYLCL